MDKTSVFSLNNSGSTAVEACRQIGIAEQTLSIHSASSPKDEQRLTADIRLRPHHRGHV